MLRLLDGEPLIDLHSHTALKVTWKLKNLPLMHVFSFILGNGLPQVRGVIFVSPQGSWTKTSRQAEANQPTCRDRIKRLSWGEKASRAHTRCRYGKRKRKDKEHDQDPQEPEPEEPLPLRRILPHRPEVQPLGHHFNEAGKPARLTAITKGNR